MIDAIEGAMTVMEVVKTLVLAAAPGRVWKALTDPEELVRWFPDKEARIEPKEGAEGAWVWESYGAYSVRFDVVDPPRRLVWTWAREPNLPLAETRTTIVEFRLEPHDEGGTTLHVREHGFVRDADRRENDAGWDEELGELVAYLEG
jgi:uncharacterized protein YndB with AHSA1/START domain